MRVFIITALVCALAALGFSPSPGKRVNAQAGTADQLAALAEQSSASAPPIVIKAARLLDGRGGPPVEPAMVRIEGERIAEVGSQLMVPKDARVIDLGNATLLPGLIDLHTHLTDRYGTNWEEALVKTTPGHNALWGAHNAR